MDPWNLGSLALEHGRNSTDTTKRKPTEQLLLLSNPHGFFQQFSAVLPMVVFVFAANLFSADSARGVAPDLF